MKSRQAKKIIMAWGRGEISFQWTPTFQKAFRKTPLAVRRAIMWHFGHSRPVPSYDQLRRFRHTRYWLSWHQPTEDYRPLTDPPAPWILGWWCSGVRYPDKAASIVALVDASCEDEAKTRIQVSWPEAIEWSFCDPRPADWIPSDRFPLSDWMRERLASAGAQSPASRTGNER